jgi:YebC/PmpR family DNA-binding regulatory protein
MSGHSKWSKIKHQKAATDASRSKEFGKIAARIAVESKLCGGDITSPALRTWIDKARAVNMPKDNIGRAIAKGKGSDMSSMDSVTYEAYGPGGVALIVTALTDNRNRTAQEVKHILSKNGLALAAPGSAAWAFTVTHEGYTPNSTMPISDEDGEKLSEIIEQLENLDDVQEVFTNAE